MARATPTGGVKELEHREGKKKKNNSIGVNERRKIPLSWRHKRETERERERERGRKGTGDGEVAKRNSLELTTCAGN